MIADESQKSKHDSTRAMSRATRPSAGPTAVGEARGRQVFPKLLVTSSGVSLYRTVYTVQYIVIFFYPRQRVATPFLRNSAVWHASMGSGEVFPCPAHVGLGTIGTAVTWHHIHPLTG